MSHRRNLAIIVFCFLIVASTMGDVVFTYDSNGNRVRREVVNVVIPPKTKIRGSKAPLVPTVVTAIPNPTTGPLTVSLQGVDGKATLVVTSICGMRMTTYEIENGFIEIDISEFGFGLYILTVIEADGSMSNVKILKI